MRTIAAFIAAFLMAAAATAATINIDSCGSTIPDNEVAALTTDLSCPAGSTAVHLGYGSTVNLNGHTIDIPNGWGVWCTAAARCTVNGGGTGGALGVIRGGQAGVYLQRNATLSAASLVITDCQIGVAAEDWNNGGGASARLTNVQISGSEGAAVQVSRVRAENVRIEGNPGNGISGSSTTSLLADGLTVTGNAFSAGCDVYGCAGIDVGDIKGTHLFVSGNAGLGIHALSATLRNSTIVDNMRAGSSRDLVISARPILRNVACNTSVGWGSKSAVHWGVCSMDGTP